jgi:hypothetical protein
MVPSSHLPSPRLMAAGPHLAALSIVKYVLLVNILYPAHHHAHLVHLVLIHPLLAHQPVHPAQLASTRMVHQLEVHPCLHVQSVHQAMQVL